MGKRSGMPNISRAGQRALERYLKHLSGAEDLSLPTLRNYGSDLRHFMAWCEASWSEGQAAMTAFAPAQVTTSTLTQYRSFLKTTLRLKPSSINRHLVSLKRYFAWAAETKLVTLDPARVVKLVPRVAQAPRHLSDREEHALVVAVTTAADLRDRTIILLLLHTGLRARELCRLQRDHLSIGQRSGLLKVYGKGNKYREVPLNATARTALQAYFAQHKSESHYLFPSGKTGGALTERALGHLIKKYATQAKLPDVSPHNLRHRFGYRMAEAVPLHRLAQIMGHNSLDTTMIYIRATQSDLQKEVEKIAWV